MSTPEEPALQRRLGIADAVTIGLGSMIGAGIFVVLAPAAAAAGSGLLIGLAIAAVVAYCNATSSARLAARYPQSGGTYVYGRERLGEFWGYTAGWSFVVGKTASCAAMALTVGIYAWPAHAHAVAVVAVVALTAINYAGVQKSAMLTRVIVATRACRARPQSWWPCSETASFATASQCRVSVTRSVRGVLQAAGLLFFAFAGYARIATLGEEVRDPARTIPRAIPIALGITLVVYAIVTVAVLAAAGRRRAGGVERSTCRRRPRRRTSRPRTRDPCRRGRRSARGVVVADPRRFEDDAGDGPRSSPSTRSGERSSAVRQPPPGRGGRRRRRRGCRGRRRRAHGDRLLGVRRADLLRDRQCIGDDVGPQSHSRYWAWSAAYCWRCCCRSPRCWPVPVWWRSARWLRGWAVAVDLDGQHIAAHPFPPITAELLKPRQDTHRDPADMETSGSTS